MSPSLQELPSPVRPAGSAAEVSVPLIGGPQRDLLCTLSYIYLACGQPDRALALLRLVERDVENDIGLLRVLAYALIAAEDGLEAIRIIERLQELDRSPNARAPLLLMRSHALRLTGRLGEARECFRVFTAARKQAEGDAS
ncbi:type III secretion apparatus assembly chaperone SctY [Bradyrhizobium cenepequi]